jgi:hypothetical protein
MLTFLFAQGVFDDGNYVGRVSLGVDRKLQEIALLITTALDR